MLLAQKPTYGYDLMEKLDKFGFESPDPGTVYRYLRNLEEIESTIQGDKTQKVFHKGDNFKTRIIKLKPGEKIPDCKMKENV